MALLAAFWIHAADVPSKPNILFILTEDQGASRKGHAPAG